MPRGAARLLPVSDVKGSFMGIQDRKYYWEDRGNRGKRPNAWERFKASVWLFFYRLNGRWARLHWFFKLWFALLGFVAVSLLLRLLR